MYEHPSFTYSTIVREQQRVDRANELRRVIAENPSRVVRREHPVLNRMRGWFRNKRADAAAPVAAHSETAPTISDPAARAAHAR